LSLVARPRRPGGDRDYETRKAVAKLIPIHTDTGKIIGSFKGKIEIKGNILSTGSNWMLNLDTHVLLCALAGEMTPRETALLSNDSWSISK
jgi:hypothetical protein